MGPDKHMFGAFVENVLKRYDESQNQNDPEVSSIRITERPPRAGYARQGMSRVLLSSGPEKRTQKLSALFIRTLLG